jgi:hypothetical protein
MIEDTAATPLPESTDSRKLMADAYTRVQLAKELRVSERTLERWCSQGIGPPRRRMGRRVIYLHNEVLAWRNSLGPNWQRSPKVAV